LRERYVKWQELGLAELGMAVATRIDLTVRASYRLGELIKRLRDEIKKSGQLELHLLEGLCFMPADQRVLYDICVAVDSFYFELRSCFEVLRRFVLRFMRQMLRKPMSEAQFANVLHELGVETSWIDPVRENRALFFHNTAPWIALEIHHRKPIECSLLVMKENLAIFDDPTKFITQREMSEAIIGLQAALWPLNKWLQAKIQEVEKASLA